MQRKRLENCLAGLIDELGENPKLILEQVWQNLIDKHGEEYVEQEFLFTIDRLDTEFRARLISKLFKLSASELGCANMFCFLKSCLMNLDKQALEILPNCFQYEQNLLVSKQGNNPVAAFDEMTKRFERRHLLQYISLGIAETLSLYGTLGFRFLDEEVNYLRRIILP